MSTERFMDPFETPKPIGRRCDASPTREHEFGPEERCKGTMHHSNPAGPIYAHTLRRCKHCHRSLCDFSNARIVQHPWM